MSKKWLAIAGVAIVVVVLVVALVALTHRSTPNASSITVSGGSGKSSTATSTSSATSTASTTSTLTSSVTGGGTSGGSKNSGSGSSSGQRVVPLRPFKPMTGSTLPLVKTNPPDAISGLKYGVVPAFATYSIVMTPVGIGPDSLFGSRILIKIDSMKPVNKAPANNPLANADVLVLVDTGAGGTVKQSGTYTATLRLVDDGTKLVPVLSQVVVK